MSKTSVCLQCGSRDWRADRSLGGRLVCSQCGAPQGSVANIRGGQRIQKRQVRIPWWWWLLLGLALVMVLQLL